MRLKSTELKPHDVIRTDILQSDGDFKFRYAIVESVTDEVFTIRPCTSFYYKDEDGNFDQSINTIDDMKESTVPLRGYKSYGMKYPTGIDFGSQITTYHSDVTWKILKTGHLNDVDIKRFDESDKNLLDYLRNQEYGSETVRKYLASYNRANKLQTAVNVYPTLVSLEQSIEPELLPPQKQKSLRTPPISTIDFNAPIKTKPVSRDFRSLDRQRGRQIRPKETRQSEDNNFEPDF